jgi:soluble lytic murein transglycosylase-like protein
LTFANYSRNELLNIAFQEGKKIGIPNTVRAMLLQETNAGQMGRIHDKGKTFGVMCIKVSTAREILNSSESYDIIRKQLIYDDYFNIKVAVKYLKYLLELFNDDINKAVLAYNVGLGRVRKYGMRFDPNKYLAKVKSKISVSSSCTSCNMCNKIKMI